MTVLTDSVLPFFALIAAGFLLVRLRTMDQVAARGLNAFVFWLALPALLFRSVAGAPLADLFNGRFLAVFYGVNALLYLGVFLVGWRLLQEPAGTAAIRALGTIWGNYGYLGLPLLISVLGPEAALPAVLVVTGDNLLPVPLTIALVEAERQRRGGPWRLLLSVLRSPLILAVLGGVLCSFAGWQPPSGVVRLLDLLADAAAPCALVALGAALAAAPLASMSGDVGTVSLVKLAINPALIWLAGRHVLPLPADTLAAAVLLGAMPTAATVFIVAQRYDVYALRASTIILLTHLGALLTLPLLILMLVP